MSRHKQIFMIAGPNGSGKTTSAQSILSQQTKIYEFINADEIARGLAPLHPESMNLTASKLMVNRLRDLLRANKSFAFETTGAGKNYLKYLHQAQIEGYEINLMYLWLSDEDLAVKRVAQRVEQGGHHVPEADVRRRYKQGLKYIMNYYLPCADNAIILDNSNIDLQKIIARKKSGEELVVEDMKTWKTIQELSNA